MDKNSNPNKSKNTASNKKPKTIKYERAKSSLRSIPNLNYNLKIDEFAIRGLNKLRNFMTPPLCDCCGEPAMVHLKTSADVCDFCGSLMYDHGCSNCAVFLIHYDGKQEILLGIPDYDEEEDEVFISQVGSRFGKEADFFAQVDADYRLCCYGLMREIEPGGWMIYD